MKRSFFFLLSAILSFIFGAMMFFIPSIAAKSLGIGLSPVTESLLHGMGGLIIGSGMINFLMRNQIDKTAISALLLTNLVTHALGISADIWGVLDGALETSKIVSVEITHLFIGGGSLIYLLRLRSSK